MPVPDFDSERGYLPSGDHPVTWRELCERFGWNTTRRELLADLKVVRDGLQSLKVEAIWLDGSFATRKERPSDVDVIYLPPPEAEIEKWGLLSPTQRVKLKLRSDIDLWAYPSYAKHGGGDYKSIKEFMSTDRDDIPRGMLQILPGDAP
ncbi:hypothetical protein O3S80_21490 [Streptomyces sp. Lzd4kr]|nr:hypothetical protein [Streptomyces sp. Lzd4kr]